MKRTTRRNAFTAIIIASIVVAPAAPSVAQTLAVCAPTTIEETQEPDTTREFAPLPGGSEPPAESPRQVERLVEDTNCSPFVYSMLSPYGEEPQVISVFGADRPNGRLHKGVDIAAPKLTPVYAVAGGVITWILDERTGDCCALAVRHDDGWTSYYIHLNNDTFATDDGLGYGIAPGVTLETRVDAGQLIGWVGDSGNAEETPPHIHFELRMPNGSAIDPLASLNNASVSSAFSLANAQNYTEPFSDDDGSVIEPILGRLASLGLISGCGEPAGAQFCPNDAATGVDLVAFIQSFLGVTIDPAAVLHYPDLGALETREALREDPCSVSYCADSPLSEPDVAILLDNAQKAAGDSPRFEALESMPKLVIGRCEDLSIDTIATRADLVIHLAQEVGILTSVPCGTLK